MKDAQARRSREWKSLRRECLHESYLGVWQVVADCITYLLTLLVWLQEAPSTKTGENAEIEETKHPRCSRGDGYNDGQDDRPL